MNTCYGVVRQILTIQKTMVRNSLKVQALLQEQGERTARAFSVPAGGLPPESERLWRQWSADLQAGRDTFASWVDAQFAMVESLLESRTTE